MPNVTRRQAAQLLVPAFGILSLAAKKRAKKRLSLPAAIDQEIERPGPVSSAFIGARVVRLSDKKILYERNQDRLFVPASNAKLFTTALALTRLGPEYRFTTSVVADGAVNAAGSLDGNLLLVGGGDPSMSGRTYPYSTETSTIDPLQPIEQLADQVAASGLRMVNGDVIGDDTRYPWAPYPGAWSIGDVTWDYGAPVSALAVNDNRISVSIAPGEAEGDPARLSLTPALEYLAIDNRVRTALGTGKAIHIERVSGSREIALWGRIGLGETAVMEQLAISDPAMFAAAALRDALQRRGITVRGSAVARHRMLEDLGVEPGDVSPAAAPTNSPPTELARRVSPPLIQLLQVVDKVSQNLHAEIVLREVGAVRRNLGTITAGGAEMQGLLGEALIEPEQVHLPDGSGLSRNALVAPAAIVNLLVFLYQSPFRDQFLSLLPVGGEDGSLRKRFEGHPESHGIRAKTGTLSGVRTLSGYATSHEHGPIAFALMINNANASSADLTKFLDNIGLKLLL